MNHDDSSRILEKRRQDQDREESQGFEGERQEGKGGIATEAPKGKTVVIYILIDPITGHIRYVGKTIIKLYRRLCQHYGGKKNRYKDRWVASLREKGLKPIIEEIERIENSDDTDWQEVERFYITYFRFLGFPLTNLDAGGTGGNLKSEETKKKIGDGNRGKVRTPETLERLRESHLGKKLTPEHCANMSKAVKGKPRGKYSPERVEKSAAAQRGKKKKPRTAEHQAKLNASQTGRKKSAETRAGISSSLKGKKRGPCSSERKAKISASLTGRKLPQEAKENMRISALKRWGKLPQDTQPPQDPCTS